VPRYRGWTERWRVVTDSETQRWQRIFAVFEEVVDAPTAQRGDMLARLCAGDEELRSEVLALIAADDTAPRFEVGLDEARRAAARDSTGNHGVASVRTGDRIGPWRLLREIGAGGMGVVWLAERADEQFEQRVALKLIRSGLDSEAVHRRFLRERQILARLHHPHIAHLIDGGITANGGPYFAMEYVEGLPLLDYCRGHEVGLEGRIRIFLDICAAVQFAHEHHVVHRDLKPSNVLVTRSAGVKLLDFGIAKLLGDVADADTITHLQREQPMTPAYAAPEQLRGGEITPATDVYALGCMLYELLTGRHTHDFRGAVGQRDVLGVIESEDPRAPSRADAASTPVPKRQLRGNLDMIVLTALRREPARRYASVAAFAADLQNHLAGKAITARREQLSHRLAVFMRRHRAGTAAALAVALTVAVVAAASWLTRTLAPAAPANATLAIVDFRNSTANKDADWLAPALAEMLATELAHGARMHALPDELVRSARSDLAPPMAGGYSTQSLATLHRRLGADYVLSGSYLVSGPPGEGRLRFDLALQDARSGAALANVAQTGALSDLAELVEKAGASLREQVGYLGLTPKEAHANGEARPQNIEVTRAMSIALEALHKYDAAKARDELLGVVAMAPGYAQANLYLAQAWKQLGYDAKAQAAARQAEANSADLPPDLRLHIEREVAVQQADWARAIELDRKSLAVDENNPELHLALIDDLTQAGKWKEFDAALADLRKLPGSGDDPRVDIRAATAAQRRNDLKSLIAFAETALRKAKARDDVALAALAKHLLAQGLRGTGKLDEAQRLFSEAAADNQQVGNPHREANAYVELARISTQQNDPKSARNYYERAREIYQRSGDQHGLGILYFNLLRVLVDLGDRDAAEEAGRRSLEIRRETGDAVGEARVLNALAFLRMDEAVSDDVMDDLRRALELGEQAGAKLPHVDMLVNYAEALRLRGDLAGAEKSCAQAQAEAQQLGNPMARITALRECALIQMDLGNVEQAVAVFSDAQKGAHEVKDSRTQREIDLSLAKIDLADGRYAQACERLAPAIEEFARGESIGNEAQAQVYMAQCLDALGRSEERDRAVERALQLRSRITSRRDVFDVDVGLAQAAVASGKRAQGVARLKELARDAAARHWLASSLEAQLALVQALQRGSDPAAAAARGSLVETARQHGFRWVLARVQSAKKI